MHKLTLVRSSMLVQVSSPVSGLHTFIHIVHSGLVQYIDYIRLYWAGSNVKIYKLTLVRVSS